MSYWIFKCDPVRYELARRLENPASATTWGVNQHKDEIGPDDIAFVWLTGDERGIRAVLHIDDAPRVRPELKSEWDFYQPKGDPGEKLRVACTITHRGVDLSSARLRKTAGLENLLKREANQGTNFHVTAEEGAILMRLVGGPRTA